VRALDAGIAVLQPERPRGELFEQQLRAFGADLGVVVAYGHLLRPSLLEIPRLGFINVHASLLPRWRGAAPIQWAILSGDRGTGVAIMRVEAGLDTGAVWHERASAITDTDTAATLTERLSHLGAEALLEALPRIMSRAEPVAQDDAGATHAPKIDRDVARIRWDEPAHAISCRIRAMDPAPGAWTTIDGTEIKVYGAQGPAARAPSPRLGVAGTILGAVDGAMHVHTVDGAVAIATVQPAGKRRMPAAEWLRGANLPASAKFE
jgi:methionyl-tRNA formyltransferase